MASLVSIGTGVSIALFQPVHYKGCMPGALPFEQQQILPFVATATTTTTTTITITTNTTTTTTTTITTTITIAANAAYFTTS